MILLTIGKRDGPNIRVNADAIVMFEPVPADEDDADYQHTRVVLAGGHSFISDETVDAILRANDARDLAATLHGDEA